MNQKYESLKSKFSFLLLHFLSNQTEIKREARERATLENVVDLIGDLAERRGENDGVAGYAVAAHGQGGDEWEIGRLDQGGVALQLHQLPGAHQDGSEFQ